MKIKQLIPALLLITPGLVMAANAADVLNARLAKLNSYQAAFKQQVFSDDGALLQQSTGQVAILRPGKFRWVTHAPLKQVIVTNGKTLWIYEPDLEQVTIRRLQQNLSATPLTLLTNKNTVLAHRFAVKALPAKQNEQLYQLSPKTTQDGFKQIVIGFKAGVFNYLELHNQLSQTTKINFSDVKLNTRLPANLFSFKVPHGADVINRMATPQ